MTNSAFQIPNCAGWRARAGAFAFWIAVFLLPGCMPPEAAREIRLDSEPTGASLSINGKDVGRTPFVFKEPVPGKYLLHFEKEGCPPLDRILGINRDTAAEVVTKLEKLTGLVLIESTPPGAEVSIDAAFRGKTPLYCTDLTAGKHKVGFVLEGYDPREVEVTINDRTPQLCHMSMKSNLASLRIESTPAGAAVLLDGLDKGRTPCVVDDVLIGKHDLKLIKEGFKDYQDQISITQASVIPIAVKMEERLASIDVSSTPADARVSVDGTYKGRTPLQIAGLRDGSYKLAIEKPSYESTNVVVEIKKMQDEKLDITLDKATGILVLNVTPVNANIFVDAELKGASGEKPLELEMPPGSYKVEVTKPKHQSKSMKAQVEARKSTKVDIALRAIWVKDNVVVLKDGRMREGMITIKYPDGGIKIETAPGVFEEFSAEEIKSIEPLKQ